MLNSPETAAGENRRVAHWFGRLGYELERYGIDAMASVFGRKFFALEHVSEVSAAIGTDDFGAFAIGVRDALDGAFDLVVEARPSAARVKLVIRSVEWCAALAAGVGAGFVRFIEFSGKGGFGPLVDYYASFGIGQRARFVLVLGHCGN